MDNRKFNSGLINRARIDLEEIKSRDEEGRIKFAHDNLVSRLREECESLNLDITARYKLVKMVMDSTKDEVREYANKIKKDLNTINSISDDIDVEDYSSENEISTEVVKPLLPTSNNREFENDENLDINHLMLAVKGTNLDKLINKGFRFISFRDGVLGVSKDGINFKTELFNKGSLSLIIDTFSSIKGLNPNFIGNLIVRCEDFIFEGYELYDVEHKQFNIDIRNTKNVRDYFISLNTKTLNITDNQEIVGIREILYSSRLNDYLKSGFKIFTYEANTLYSDGEHHDNLKFSEDDADYLLNRLGKKLGKPNLSDSKMAGFETNLFELLVLEGADGYISFKLDLTKFPGLPLKSSLFIEEDLDIFKIRNEDKIATFLSKEKQSEVIRIINESNLSKYISKNYTLFNYNNKELRMFKEGGSRSKALPSGFSETDANELIKNLINITDIHTPKECTLDLGIATLGFRLDGETVKGFGLSLNVKE